MTEDFIHIKLTLYSSTPTSKATTAVSRKSVSACSLSVCLSVCLSACTTRKPHKDCFVHVTYVRRLFVLCNKLSNFGFVNDVMFSSVASTGRITCIGNLRYAALFPLHFHRKFLVRILRDVVFVMAPS